MSSEQPVDAPVSHGWRIGSIHAVPIFVSPSWLVIAAIIVLTFGPDVADALPRIGLGGAYAVALAYAVLLAVSVLCHEATHAVVARACGYSVQRIVVNLWGGHTAFSAPAPTPGRSALVSVAGPVANAVLAGAGWALLPFAPSGVARLLVYAWTFSNAFVAIFNLLPGLPLDGGFLVDALVWHLTGRRSAGMVAAGWGGRLVIAVALVWLVVLPLARGERLSLVTVAWFAFLGAFLWAGASSAISAGRSLAVLERIRLGAVLSPVAAVPEQEPADRIGHRVAAVAPSALPVVVDRGGRPSGLVDPGAYARIPEQSLSGVPTSALLLAQPTGWLAEAPWVASRPGHAPVVDEMASIAPYLPALVESPYGVVVLTDPAGRPVGAVTSGDVERAASGA